MKHKEYHCEFGGLRRSDYPPDTSTLVAFQHFNILLYFLNPNLRRAFKSTPR